MSVYKFKIKLLKGQKLLIEEKNFHPRPAVYQEGDQQLIIVGSPIYRHKIDNKTVSGKLFARGMDRSLVGEFDGSFLLIWHDEASSRIVIANDRFASIPLYYYSDEKGFVGSINYSDIWNELRKEGKLSLNRYAFYEFIYLQRLIGEKTYDKRTLFLSSATMLTWNARNDDLRCEKYWRPCFDKKVMLARKASGLLADLTAAALAERTSDTRRFGLLLSGGLDSRLVLSAFRGPVECMTVGSVKNNEYAVASELAAVKKCPHHFVARGRSHYVDILDEAVYLGSAMNVYAHAHFLGLDAKLREKADVFFHGHGFDYLFQGKYLPRTILSLGGKRTYVRRLTALTGDVRDRFLSGVGYRLRSVNPLLLVIDREKKRVRESSYASLEEVLKEGRKLSDNAYDLWEYLIMHNLSRHYTFLNIASIRTIAEERTLAFDNELLDFYLSLPAVYRFDRKVFTDAIRILDKRLYGVRNSNNNFPIYDSDLTLTAKLCFNKLLHACGCPVLLPPVNKDRSWPVKADILRENAAMEARARNIYRSTALEMLDFLDLNRVKFYVDEHFRRIADHADLIMTLITIDSFIQNQGKRIGPDAVNAAQTQI